MSKPDTVQLTVTREDAARLLDAVDRHRTHAESAVAVFSLARGRDQETDPTVEELLADAVETLRSMATIAEQFAAQGVGE